MTTPTLVQGDVTGRIFGSQTLHEQNLKEGLGTRLHVSFLPSYSYMFVCLFVCLFVCFSTPGMRQLCPEPYRPAVAARLLRPCPYAQ